MTMLIALILAQIAGTPGQIQTPNAGRWVSTQGSYQCTGTGCTTRTIAAKLGDALSVCDKIGPVCPSGGDDTAAIQATIDQASANPYPQVYMPPGKYKITGLTINHPVTLTGAGNARGVNATAPDNAGQGYYLTELQNTSTANAAITIAPVSTERLTGVYLRDFSIKGNRDVVGASAGHGVALLGGAGQIERFICNGVTVWRAYGDGWNINGTVFLSDWFNCQAEDGRLSGFNIAGGNPSQIQLFGGSYSYNLLYGFSQSIGSTSGVSASLSAVTLAGNATGLSVSVGAVKTSGWLNLEENTVSGVEVSTGGNEFHGLNITSPSANNFVGINCKNGSGKNWFDAVFGAFGTTPTHIKVDAGSVGPQFFRTGVDPSTLTITAQGVEVFLDSPWLKLDKNGAATLGGHTFPSADNTRDLGQAGQRFRFLYANVANLSQIATGLGNDGSGFKHKRVAVGCTTAAAVGAACTSAALAWGTAFADANYTIACTLTGPTGQPHISSVAQIAASFTVTIAADTAVAATGTVDCIAVHD
jgi:hypothetical protein